MRHLDTSPIANRNKEMHRDGASGLTCPSPHPVPIAYTSQAGTITGDQLFGQPCVNVRVQSAALPRLAAGNSANKKKKRYHGKGKRNTIGCFQGTAHRLRHAGPIRLCPFPGIVRA